MSNSSSLILIPKALNYISYCYIFLNKLPRVEKFNIGNEFKNIMYDMLNNIVYLNKISYNRIMYLNKIDSDILIQRLYLRIMFKNRYIDSKKFDYSILLLDELGKLVGGYIKSEKKR